MDARGRALDGGARTDVDDLAVALLAHLRDHRAARKPRTAQVHCHHAVPLRRLDLVERRARHRHSREDRRVVHQDIDAPESLERAPRHLVYARLLGHVRAHRERPGAKPGRDPLGRRAIELGDHHGGALVGQALRVGLASDDGDAIRESFFHREKV